MTEKTLKRIVTLAFVALAFCGGANAQAADYKIGFVNTERLFREATPAKRAQQKLEKEFATRDAEIQKLTKQVRDLQTSLDKDGATMAEAERRNKERDLANMSRDLSARSASSAKTSTCAATRSWPASRSARTRSSCRSPRPRSTTSSCRTRSCTRASASTSPRR